MRIVVLGTGRMGGSLAKALVRETDHQVAVRGSSLHSASASALAAEIGVEIADDSAIAAADMVFVATQWADISPVALLLAGHKCTVVSMIVPWADGGDPRSGPESAAEVLAAQVPGVSLVTAFTTISSELLREPSRGDKPGVFVCGEDESAKSDVMNLATELGFEAFEAGPLRSSRYVEDMGLLLLHLAYRAGHGRRAAFRLVTLP